MAKTKAQTAKVKAFIAARKKARKAMKASGQYWNKEQYARPVGKVKLTKSLFKKLTAKRRRRKKRSQKGSGEGFLNKMINKLPIEAHLPGHRFTGPGTKLEKRLDKNDNPLPHSKPRNRVDATSLKHDICYRDNRDKAGRTRCDRKMLGQLRKIQKPSFREKLDRALVSRIIMNKVNMRM